MHFWVYLLRIAILGALISIVYLLYKSSIMLENSFRRFYLVPMTTVPPPIRIHYKAGPKTIVWYDTFHKGHGLRNSVSNAKFDQCRGSAKNCEILPHVLVNKSDDTTVVDADAVIFQGAHLREIPVPRRKDSNQVFVLAVRENLINNYDKMLSRSNLIEYKNIINWTMTYRHDSDILLPYGEVRPATASVPSENLEEIFETKKYEVVWFVSHCSTPSKREKFVRELQKYIPVHIYGKCGNFTCPRKKVQRDSTDDCLENVIRNYKFILSFENTYIPNYVTEKFFDWFPRNMVQVVRGGGGDYSAYGAPTGSVIYADEFSSAKDLGLFLRNVSSNVSMYTQYLAKKHGYYSVSTNEKQTESYCKLCRILQDVQRYRKSYNNIWAWLDSDLFSQTFYDRQYSKTVDMYTYFVFIQCIAWLVLFFYLLRKATVRFLLQCDILIAIDS